jgi:hypothetical protein
MTPQEFDAFAAEVGGDPGQFTTGAAAGLGDVPDRAAWAIDVARTARLKQTIEAEVGKPIDQMSLHDFDQAAAAQRLLPHANYPGLQEIRDAVTEHVLDRSAAPPTPPVDPHPPVDPPVDPPHPPVGPPPTPDFGHGATDGPPPPDVDAHVPDGPPPPLDFDPPAPDGPPPPPDFGGHMTDGPPPEPDFGHGASDGDQGGAPDDDSTDWVFGSGDPPAPDPAPGVGIPADPVHALDGTDVGDLVNQYAGGLTEEAVSDGPGFPGSDSTPTFPADDNPPPADPGGMC